MLPRQRLERVLGLLPELLELLLLLRRLLLPAGPDRRTGGGGDGRGCHCHVSKDRHWSCAHQW